VLREILESKGDGVTGEWIKDHPRTGHEDPEGEQMYSSTLPSTSAGVGGQHHAPAALPPRKDSVHTVQEAGWAPGGGLEGYRKISPPLHRDSIPGPSSP
jgi:hypothetical protein